MTPNRPSMVLFDYGQTLIDEPYFDKALGMAAVETAGHLPALAWLDSVRPADLGRQVPILLAGLFLYAALLALTYRICARRYETVDL